MSSPKSDLDVGTDGDSSKIDSHKKSSLRTPLYLLAGVIGGLLGGIVSHNYYGVFPRPEMSAKYYKESEERWASLDFSPDVVAEIKEKGTIRLERNSALALAIIGGILGGLLCLMTGIVRRKWTVILAGPIGGALIGGVSGTAAGFAGVWLSVFLERFQLTANTPADLAGRWLRQMYLSVAVHAAEWSLVGVGVGLAVALASGRAKVMGRTIGYAITAGLLAAIAYTPLAALPMLFPGEASGTPFPEGSLGNVILFAMLPCVAMALLLALSAADNRKKAAAQPQAAADTPRTTAG